jgi:hypothetical protein
MTTSNVVRFQSFHRETQTEQQLGLHELNVVKPKRVPSTSRGLSIQMMDDEKPAFLNM